MNIPAGLENWTADEIAECLPVGDHTYRRLWQISAEASNKKPLGGDGTGGTVEWPEVRSDCDDQPLSFWEKLTKEEQADIAQAYARRHE